MPVCSKLPESPAWQDSPFIDQLLSGVFAGMRIPSKLIISGLGIGLMVPAGSVCRVNGDGYANPLLDFNISLNDCLVSELNENYIETKIDELEEIGDLGSIYQLTLARITELALICAGNYADNMEFSAAGDLLVNPRQIHILMEGFKEPILKNRHLGLTQQLKSETETHAEAILWLSRHTELNIIEQPLLPDLYDRLKNFETISSDYLQSIDRRMKKIADVIGFLSACRLPEPDMFYNMKQWTSKAEVDFICANLCEFSHDLFFELGSDILRLIEDDQNNSRFIRSIH